MRAGIEGEEQSDSDEDHGLDRDAAHLGEDQEHARSEQGEHEGVCRHQEGSHARDEGNAHDDREGRAEARRRRHSEGEGVGERVVEDGLHLGPGDPQHRSDQHRHERDWQTDVPDDHIEGEPAAAGTNDCGEHVAQGEAAWPDGGVADDGHQEDDSHERYQGRSSRRQAPIARAGGRLFAVRRRQRESADGHFVLIAEWPRTCRCSRWSGTNRAGRGSSPRDPRPRSPRGRTTWQRPAMPRSGRGCCRTGGRRRRSACP